MDAMAILVVPRVFGGTLIIVEGPPATAITAIGRDGKVSGMGRDGKHLATGRNGQIIGKGR